MHTCKPSPDEPLGRLFAHTSKLHRDLLRKLAHQNGLEHGQPIALAIIIANEGISQRQLSEKLFITPASTTALLQKLEKAGLIERRPDPNDQRAFCIYATEKGRMVDQQMKEGLQELEKACFHNFSEQELIEFRRLLLKLHENLCNLNQGEWGSNA
ncbi:DNA-binding MarR family transcriptional regulator [Caldicoprobacter guelmensis]|uniref:MarR family winged helix-turn-helix transcriptional regulator n=1 Tax=Caldicoprobacter guelmensis TaxID=1170224 RepID=UPI00195D6E31|nr:MarR family transcriptional regulator [Caldicoprobacter guelmensis]MBM7583216.1 DNA-binding MarR family transcriptional regulator [Caldicoprobacter guelmensis]